MSSTGHKAIYLLFGSAIFLFVALVATACIPLIRPPGAVTMPSAMLAPEQAQRQFTSYCVDYELGPSVNPEIRFQLAWQRTDDARGFNRCGVVSMKTNSDQSTVPIFATCAVDDKLYHYLAPAWQIRARNRDDLLYGVSDPTGLFENDLATLLDWPIDQLIAQSQLIGIERMEQQQVLHYQSKDMNLLSKLGFKPSGFPPQQGQVDVWIAPALNKGETSYVMKYQIDLTSEQGWDQRAFTFSHVNQPFQLQPPPQAVAYATKLNAALARGHAILPTCYACDIPLPPDGSIEPPNMMTSPALIINTPQAGAAIVAYYEQQLPKEGWQVKPETQGDDMVHLLLTRGAQQVSLQILFDQPATPTRILAFHSSPTQAISPTDDVVGLNQYCNP